MTFTQLWLATRPAPAVASPDPRTVHRATHINRTRQQEAAADRWMKARRREAARNGYRGPLTRAELAALAARQEAPCSAT
jgi:hypothetical protein